MSLPGFEWTARADRNVSGHDPLNAWLLTDGFDFFELDTVLAGNRSQKLDFAVRLDARPPSIRGGGQSSFVQISSNPLSTTRTDNGSFLFQGQRSISGRNFVMPLSQHSIGSDQSRLRGGFDLNPWTKPADVDPNSMVIVGVIDHAINIAHPRFQNAKSGSRVDLAWIQDGEGLSSRPVPYGRVWSAADIDAAVAGDASHEEVLRSLDLINFADDRDNPLALRLSHGTHVTDIAAGADPTDDRAINTRLLTVTLPTLVAQETSGGLLSLFFIQGLDFLLRQARVMSVEVGQAIPVLINFSFSVSGGPRGGNHIIERSIETLFDEHQEALTALGLPPVRPEIYMPAGNRNLARSHAVASPAPTGEVAVSFPWRIQPEDRTPSYLEIWLPADATAIAVTVNAPGHPALATPVILDDQTPHILWQVDQPDTVLARLSLDRIETRQRVFLAVAATHVNQGPRTPLPSGLWSIALTAQCPSGGTCEAWILRDDTPPGFRQLGRQSYFDDPAYQRFDERGDIAQTDPAQPRSIVRRAGTSNGLATGQNASFVVSGFRSRELERDQISAATAAYSATLNIRYNRHLGAISDTSRVNGGVLAAGTAGGSRLAMNGTSVATPQAVRQRVADLFSPTGRNVTVPLEQVFDHRLAQPQLEGRPPREVRGVLTRVLEDSDKPQR